MSKNIFNFIPKHVIITSKQFSFFFNYQERKKRLLVRSKINIICLTKVKDGKKNAQNKKKQKKNEKLQMMKAINLIRKAKTKIFFNISKIFVQLGDIS